MIVKTRLILVVAALLTALAEGSLIAGPARAEGTCLVAPNTTPPQGSHWYYRTDPATQSKCWYLRIEGQTIEKRTAQENTETNVTTKRPATSPRLEPLGLRPTRTAPVASSDRPTSPAGADIVTWPDPPQPAGAGKVAWPDPPITTGTDKLAWAAPPIPTGADKVEWDDPPTSTGADKVARPNPPSSVGGTPREAAAEISLEDRARQTHEVPVIAADSNKDARNDTGVGGHVAEPSEKENVHSKKPVDLLLAFAIGLVIAGIVVRWIVSTIFTRRRTLHTVRREPAWTTSIASGRTIPKLAVPHCELAPGSVAAERLRHEGKEALRKLLQVLETQAV